MYDNSLQKEWENNLKRLLEESFDNLIIKYTQREGEPQSTEIIKNIEKFRKIQYTNCDSIEDLHECYLQEKREYNELFGLLNPDIDDFF